jgi:hypothetical protein
MKKPAYPDNTYMSGGGFNKMPSYKADSSFGLYGDGGLTKGPSDANLKANSVSKPPGDIFKPPAIASMGGSNFMSGGGLGGGGLSKGAMGGGGDMTGGANADSGGGNFGYSRHSKL